MICLVANQMDKEPATILSFYQYNLVNVESFSMNCLCLYVINWHFGTTKHELLASCRKNHFSKPWTSCFSQFLFLSTLIQLLLGWRTLIFSPDIFLLSSSIKKKTYLSPQRYSFVIECTYIFGNHVTYRSSWRQALLDGPSWIGACYHSTCISPVSVIWQYNAFCHRESWWPCYLHLLGGGTS